jgi:hypothetical protein
VSASQGDGGLEVIENVFMIDTQIPFEDVRCLDVEAVGIAVLGAEEFIAFAQKWYSLGGEHDPGADSLDASEVTLVAGAAVLATNGSCTATACDENRTRNAAGGVLVGVGAAVMIGGTYVTIVRSRGGDPVTGFSVAFRF